jgi:hypothetical protein
MKIAELRREICNKRDTTQPQITVTFPSHSVLATGWKVWGSNPSGGDIFRTPPDRPWGPPILLYSGYRVSFPGIKRPGCGLDHPPQSRAEVKERVELYLYSPSGPSWTVLG